MHTPVWIEPGTNRNEVLEAVLGPKREHRQQGLHVARTIFRTPAGAAGAFMGQVFASDGWESSTLQNQSR